MNSQRPSKKNRRDLASQETRSFRDPLGEAGFTRLIDPPEKLEVAPDSKALASQEPEELDVDKPTDGDPDDILAEPRVDTPPDFPVEQYYRACYVDCWAEGESGRRFIAGYEGITGREISSRAAGGYAASDNAAEGAAADIAETSRELLSVDGSVVAHLVGSEVEELNELETAGFVVRCFMAISLYHSKEKRFSATVACIAYSSALNELQQSAMQEYINGMTSRLGFGSRPDLQLDQQQFDHVLSSSGRWYMTKDLPEATYPSGTFIHRRRRSLSDSLISAAVEHRLGCNTLTWVFLISLAALVVYLVFFR